MNITINHRFIDVKLFVQQGSSEVNPVIFLLPSIDEGVTLSDCNFFVSVVDGQGYDKIPLSFTEEGDTLQVKWNIESRTTEVEGNHPFQLVAENVKQEVVWLTNTSHVIVRESLHVDDPISGMLPSVLQAYQERMDQLEESTEGISQKAQEFAERAGKYAQQTAQDKDSTAADRVVVEQVQSELSEKFDTVLEKLEEMEDLVNRAEEAARQIEKAETYVQEVRKTAANIYNLLPLVTVSKKGSVELPSCIDTSLKECIIYGAHIQEGTPTPEAPISPTFVGGSGNITISITGIEPKMIPIPYPLIDADDYLNLTTGQGETTWKGIELIGTESWQKSGKTAVGGTVFYVTLSDQDTQGTTKRVFSTHFQQAQNAGALVPGDIWMHNATFIAMPNTLLGIIDSDNDNQKVEKFKSWLSSQKESGSVVKVWYQPTKSQAVEISPVTLTTGKGNVTLTVSGAEGEPAPDIQVTAVQDWTMLKEEQEKKNRSYEERLNALEANVTGG